MKDHPPDRVRPDKQYSSSHQSRPYFMARFQSICQECRKPIIPGDSIRSASPKGYRHYVCPETLEEWGARRNP